MLTRELCQPPALRVLPRPSKSRPRTRVYRRRWDVEVAWSAYEPLPADLAEVA